MAARTLVSFHAHPDDEALLTGGTLARAAAAGHRVVLVVATQGEAGLAASAATRAGLGQTRAEELAASAQALGCARVVCLGMPDSGWRSEHASSAVAFSSLPIPVAAEPLAQILREEDADVLTIYDPAGGYGHPDHQQVHRAGLHAAGRAGTPCVLEATLPRERLWRAVRIASMIPGLLDSVTARDFENAYTERRHITHQVDVRDSLAAKRAAMLAHASQATSDIGPRTLSLLLRLPAPVFSWVCGTEWFTERRGASGLAREVLGSH